MPDLDEHFDSIMKKIETTMEEIRLLEIKKNIDKFYTRFLVFVIIANHFHILIDTNYTILSNVYNVIESVDNQGDYEIIDYAEGLEIESVD